MKQTYETVRGWMHRNARPLDLARWRLHFENGPREDVYRALSFYQNTDGGFGHALEADNWNPHSTPMTTSAAIDMLCEAGPDGAPEITNGILRYLDSGDGFADGVWRATIETNNDFPRAPWWTYDPASANWGYNPSAQLAGFCLIGAEKGSPLYRKAFGIARSAVDAFFDKGCSDMHEAPCYIALAAELDAAGLSGEFDTARIREELGAVAGKVIERDTSKWKTEYVCLPSYFIRSPQSPLYPQYRELVEQELDMIENSLNGDGVWDITWKWAGYEREFAISENWWKGNLVIQNMLLLREFDRL